MATLRKSASAQHHEGETGLERRWWRSPAVITVVGSIIVAVIGAIGLVTKAYIERPDPKPTASAPMTIEQRTHGAGSPNVGHAGGNVTIHQQGGGEKP